MPVSGSGFSTGWLVPVDQTLGFDTRALKESSRDFYFGQPAGGPITVTLTLQTLTVLNRTPPVQISGIYPVGLNVHSVTNRSVTVQAGVSVVLSLIVHSVTHRAVTIVIPGTENSVYNKSRKKRRTT